MAETVSPLGSAYRPGLHGNMAAGAGVVLSETQPGSIVQVAAWRGREPDARAAIAAVTGLSLDAAPGAGMAGENRSAFGFAPGRFLVIDAEEDLAARLAAAVTLETGTVTDLSHGRVVIRVAGPKAEWVLQKFFAIDFSRLAVGDGISTAHHDVFAQIQKATADAYDLVIFRSFARSFWHALEKASAEVGYEVR